MIENKVNSSILYKNSLMCIAFIIKWTVKILVLMKLPLFI